MLGSEQFAGGAEYTISINEEQRGYIETALLLFSANTKQDFSPERIEEVSILHDLFKGLPEAEKKDPKAIHGFNI